MDDKKNKTFILLVIMILFIALIVVCVAMVITVKSLNANGTNAQQAADEDIEEFIFDLPEDIMTNLAPSESKEEGYDKHIAKITFSIVLNSESKDFKKMKLEEKMTEKLVITKSIMMNSIRTRTYEDLRAEGGIADLSQEILGKLQDEFKTNAILEVVISEYFIQ